MKSKRCIASLLLFSIFFLTGCSKNEKNSINEKVTAETNFLSSELIEMMNALNNISFENFKLKVEEIEEESEEQGNSSGGDSEQSKESSQEKSGSSQGESGGQKDNKIENKKMTMEEDSYLSSGGKEDWDKLKSKIEILVDSWSQIAMDFKEVGFEDEEVNKIEKEFNKLITNIKDENKIETAKSIAQIYSYIPQVLEIYTEEKLELNYEKIKAKVLEAYAILEQDDWNNVAQKITEAKNIVGEAKKVANEKNEKVDSTKKIEVLLQELENCLEEENKDIFFIRYKNLMKEFS